MNYLVNRNNFFLISLGAIPAALLRWQINEIIIVNLLGCFLIGFLNSLTLPKKYKLLFGFSFCGSLTTFSGWIFDLYKLIIEGLYKEFLFNLILFLVGGIFAVVFGNLLGQKINKLS